MLSFRSINTCSHRCTVYLRLERRSSNEHSERLRISTGGRTVSTQINIKLGHNRDFSHIPVSGIEARISWPQLEVTEL